VKPALQCCFYELGWAEAYKTPSKRSTLIRLAAKLAKDDPKRKAILAELSKSAADVPPKLIREIEKNMGDPDDWGQEDSWSDEFGVSVDVQNSKFTVKSVKFVRRALEVKGVWECEVKLKGKYESTITGTLISPFATELEEDSYPSVFKCARKEGFIE
jgi:hypothetical protein